MIPSVSCTKLGQVFPSVPVSKLIDTHRAAAIANVVTLTDRCHTWQCDRPQSQWEIHIRAAPGRNSTAAVTQQLYSSLLTIAVIFTSAPVQYLIMQTTRRPVCQKNLAPFVMDAHTATVLIINTKPSYDKSILTSKGKFVFCVSMIKRPCLATVRNLWFMIIQWFAWW